MGIVGSALSMTLAMAFNLILTLLYIEYYMYEVQESFVRIERSSFNGLWAYFKEILPSVVIMGSEMWAEEILTIFSRIVSVSCLDAQVIATNYYIIIQTMAIGIEYAGEILIGYNIGAKNVKEAKKYRLILSIFAFGIPTFTTSILLMIRHAAPKLYTSLPRVVY